MVSKFTEEGAALLSVLDSVEQKVRFIFTANRFFWIVPISNVDVFKWVVHTDIDSSKRFNSKGGLFMLLFNRVIL